MKLALRIVLCALICLSCYGGASKLSVVNNHDVLYKKQTITLVRPTDYVLHMPMVLTNASSSCLKMNKNTIEAGGSVTVTVNNDEDSTCDPYRKTTKPSAIYIETLGMNRSIQQNFLLFYWDTLHTPIKMKVKFIPLIQSNSKDLIDIAHCEIGSINCAISYKDLDTVGVDKYQLPF